MTIKFLYYIKIIKCLSGCASMLEKSFIKYVICKWSVDSKHIEIVNFRYYVLNFLKKCVGICWREFSPKFYYQGENNERS